MRTRLGLLIGLFACMGCYVGCAGMFQQQSSSTITPGSAKITRTTSTSAPVKTVTEKLDEAGKVVERVTETGGEVTTVDFKGEAVGAAAAATGTTIDSTISGSPPAITADGSTGATGGDIAQHTKAETVIPKNLWSNPLLYVGILCVLGAGAAMYFGLRRAAFIAAVVGGGFIVAAMLPTWAWIVVAVIGVVGGGVYLYAEYASKRNKEALRAVVGGIGALSETDPDAYKKVKAEVGKQAEPRDVDTIAKIKVEDRV